MCGRPQVLHQTATKQGHAALGLRLWPYCGPEGVAFSHERGTPVVCGMALFRSDAPPVGAIDVADHLFLGISDVGILVYWYVGMLVCLYIGML